MRKKYEKCVQYEKTSYLCPPVCRAGECGKIWTACNHNKKSLKQHVFYSNSQFFPFYTFYFLLTESGFPHAGTPAGGAVS